MSRLPKGTKAARALIESVIIKGAMAKATALLPFLGWPVFRHFLQYVFEHVLLDPAMDEATGLAYAATFLVDRVELDNKFIELSMLDKQNAPPVLIEEKLQNAEKALERFVRRGPIE